MKKSDDASILSRVVSVVFTGGPGLLKVVMDKIEFLPSLEIVRRCESCGADQVWLEFSIRVGRREAYMGACARCVQEFLVKTPGAVTLLHLLAVKMPGVFDELDAEAGKGANGRPGKTDEQKVLPFLRS